VAAHFALKIYKDGKATNRRQVVSLYQEHAYSLNLKKL